MDFLLIAYAVVMFLFALIGFCTTPRARLDLPLFIICALAWPVSLIVVGCYIVAERLGLVRRRSGLDAGGEEPKPAQDAIDLRVREKSFTASRR